MQNQVYYLHQKLSPIVSIYQYMDFDYFLNLVEYNQYWISYKNVFKDKRESSIFSAYIFPFYPIGATISDEQKRKDEERIHEKLESQKKASFWPTSCWTLASAESFLMWKAYTSKIGVRVETTIDSFVSAINAPEYYILGGEISYGGHLFNQDVNYGLFSKDKYYGDEREFRFILKPQNEEEAKIKTNSEKKEGVLVGMDSNALIKSVILSPFIHKGAAQKLKRILESEMNLTGKVNISQIEIK